MSYKLDLIKKYAQEVPVPSTPRKPAAAPATPAGAQAPAKSDVPPKPGTPVQNQAAAGKSQVQQISGVVNAIKEMQNAMQNLSQTVITDSEAGSMSFKQKDVISPAATDDVKTAKKSFNDFIAEQYLGSLDEERKGVEWTKDPKTTTLPGKQKTQTDIYELDVVMDTLRRIGAGTKEFSADGKWDFRTDNALRNIMGFTYALLQLEGDFGLENHLYTFEDWKKLNQLLSGYKIENGVVKLSPKAKLFRATNITKHLKSITKLYNHFRQQVLAKPEFRPTIEGKRSFDRYDAKGTNKDVLTQAEDQMSKSDTQKVPVEYIAPALPNKKLNFIPLKALRSKDEYIKWMVDYAGNSEEAAINIFNKVIKPQIESM